ncbi:unknown protein [Mesoplasma florum L1]|uniref:Uncharacterized protein n=3 Tax=Mesoplasma florum TaxID=2151 RepID=Q6F1A6_MESFL|nr:hypothetical protein [Mesoplasma florum]AAT75717.1 unknown protein [Mesoplasma florum L1]AGY41447.1 hypothetical protein mflW37_3800 [Mesoplasma florum W37]ATI73322.1 hypothetical protein CQZ69_01950 [Mesoplasma florum]ATI74000.1 hypothetical protein CQZ70_01900 [Mesoplasma florum]AVN59665.1 hypothetical protein CG008_01980 [Mesoplasma florum]
MNNEIEVDFLEPGLAIVISSLENVEAELKNKKELTSLLDNLNEVEELEDLTKLLNKLNDIEKDLLKEIKSLNHKEEFEIISDLQIAIAMSNFLAPNEFLFEFTDSIEAKSKANEIIVNQENILEIFKEIIIKKVNEVYGESLSKFKNVYDNENEFIKVLKIAFEESNLNDLREASKLMINLLKIDRTINDEKKYEFLEILNKAESLINLIDIWSQYEMDFEEE